MIFEVVDSVAKRCHKNCITSLSLYDNKIATGGKDSTVLIHQKTESELTCVSKFNLIETNQNKCNITCVDYLDNLVLASTTLGLINIMDNSNKKVSNFTAHRNVVSYVKFFTEDKNLILSCGFDNKVRLWDLRNLKVPIQDLIGHTANVNYVDNLLFPVQDEDLVSFGENYERVLSCSSDRTVRLWNINRGTHLAFKIPIEMSQNVECCCLMARKPCYLFAVGLDDNYLMVFSSKLKNYIGSYSLGANISVNCIRHFDGFLLVGVSSGELLFFKYKFNENYTECDLKLVQKVNYQGSLNDFKIERTNEGLVVYSAVATEVRLGRWSTNLSTTSRNQIVVKEFKLFDK